MYVYSMLFSVVTIQNRPDKPLQKLPVRLYLDFISCFAPRIAQVFVADSGYDKEPLLKRIGNSRKNNVADCSSVEIGVKRIERDIPRGEQKRGRFPRHRANISIHSGLGFRACRVYTDVYVSRYWTKVAPSVLDATRSDISSGTPDFSFGEEGETTRRVIFLRLQLDVVTHEKRSPFAGAFLLSLPLSRSRDNEIYELYTLYEPSDCGSV